MNSIEDRELKSYEHLRMETNETYQKGTCEASAEKISDRPKQGGTKCNATNF